MDYYLGYGIGFNEGLKEAIFIITNSRSKEEAEITLKEVLNDPVQKRAAEQRKC